MVATTQASNDLDGVPTEVLIQVFADRILVIITQLGKVGNLIQATIPATEPLLPPLPSADPDQPTLPTPPNSIQLVPLLGAPPSEHLEALHSLYASSAATLVWTHEANGPFGGERRPVVVGIALKKSDGPAAEGSSEHERKVFFGVMKMIRELLARE